jgi:PhnB protein
MSRKAPSRAIAVVPHLFVKDVPAALSFYSKAFGAVELFRNLLPDGTILFVELAVGDARLLVSEEVPQLDALAPTTLGGTPMLLTLETEDPDDLFRRALFAGATVEAPIEEMFFGERYGRVVDPSGHRWALTTKREQFTPEDIDARTPREV